MNLNQNKFYINSLKKNNKRWKQKSDKQYIILSKKKQNIKKKQT